MFPISITGRLVRDTTVKFTPSGAPVSNFTIAVDTGCGDRKETIFIGCSLWGKKAESLEAYLLKGVLTHATGEAGLRKWTAKDGTSGAEITLNCSDVNPFLEKKTDRQSTDAPKSDGFRKPPTPKANDFADDDLPF